MTTDPQWPRIEELFAAALQLPAEERDAFLAAQEPGDPHLQSRVRRLLAADAVPGDPLGEAVRAEARLLSSPQKRRFGPWVIRERLGEGGMSTVFLAVRGDRQFQKKVALKVIKWGLESAELVRRFEMERQILATLEHPNIARLLDAGATDDGRPYFVMEYVDGEPIDAFCDRRRLSLDERLELFDAVCSAVTYAHQSLIVHRDLKPGNILVTEDGVPKLLDFGIAKLLDPARAALPVAVTDPGGRPLTPRYASPEQFTGGAITTASDVYSLGVLLYELLCGRAPFQLQGRSAQDAERVVREDLPPLPSQTLATSPAGDETAVEITARRGLPTAQLRRRLQDDLDLIVLTALRKEPRRRYPTAAALAADLRRHRNGLPVTARPDTFTYRAGKFLRRHRFGVATAGLAALLLTAFVIALGVQSVRLAHQRDVAERERGRAQRASEFMVELFHVSDPDTVKADMVTVEDLLAQGAAKAYRELGEDPVTQAQVLESIGRSYQQLSLYPQAIPLLKDTLALRERELGPEHPEVANTLNRLAISYGGIGDYTTAEPLFERALEVRRRIFGEQHLHVARAQNNLALVRHDLGKFLDAETLYRQSLQLTEELHGPDSLELAPTLDNLGLLLCDLGDFAEAEPYLLRSRNIRHAAGADEQARAHSLVQLGIVRAGLGDLEAAEEMLREAVPLFEEHLDPEDPEVSRTLARLGHVLLARGDADQAIAVHRRALELRHRRLGTDHPEAAASLVALAQAHLSTGDSAAAEPLLEQAHAIWRATLPPQHPDMALVQSETARLLVSTGRSNEALPLLRNALTIRRTAFRPEDPRTEEIAELLERLERAAGATAAIGGRFFVD